MDGRAISRVDMGFYIETILKPLHGVMSLWSNNNIDRSSYSDLEPWQGGLPRLTGTSRESGGLLGAS